jgi:hypothetical protein
MLFTIEPTLLSNLRTVLFLAQHFFISSLDACPPMLRSFHSRLLLFLAGFPFVHDPHHIIKRSHTGGAHTAQAATDHNRAGGSQCVPLQMKSCLVENSSRVAPMRWSSSLDAITAALLSCDFL